MLRSQRFVRAESQARLLAFLVEQTQKGLVPSKWEIGVKVLKRGSDWMLEDDARVRVYLKRLKETLDDYYAREGSSDPVVIGIAVRTVVAEYKRQPRIIAPSSSGILEKSFVEAREAFFIWRVSPFCNAL